jgi:hypothetical protein
VYTKLSVGDIAQLVERFFSMEEVSGSIPDISTFCTLSQFLFTALSNGSNILSGILHVATTLMGCPSGWLLVRQLLTVALVVSNQVISRL